MTKKDKPKDERNRKRIETQRDREKASKENRIGNEVRESGASDKVEMN